MTDRRSRQREDLSVAAAERPLPHSLEAERSVLGAILVHNDAFEVASALISPHHFYRDAHRRIFTAMTTLRQKAVDVDFVTLREELTRTGELDEVGGPAYVSSLPDGVPRTTNVRHYAQIVAEKFSLRELIYASNKILTAAYEADMPAAVIVSEADRTLLALQAGGLSGDMRSLSQTSGARFQELEWRVAHKGELRGVTTGYDSINELTLGLRAGDLDIIAARPSIGKSTIALNIGVHAARAQRRHDTARHRVAVFSLEMTREQLEDRILAQLSGVALSRIQSGHIGSEDWPKLSEAISEMGELGIAIDDRSGQTAVDVRNGCRRLIAEHGSLDLAIVDYVQLMPGTLERKGASRTEELSDTATRLKDLAKELGIPVILLSQLRRHEGRPKIEDLRECGTLEQVADMVGLLHRKDHRVSGTTEFILAKQRNGACGTVLLTLDRDTTTFTDAPNGTTIEAEPHEDKQGALHARNRTFAARYRNADRRSE